MKFVIYARKSSESEDRQTLSIQSQIIEMQQVAAREGVQVVKIFQEAKSSKAPGRPVFNEMIQFIQDGKAQGILCWKIDRLARNPVDEGIIKWMLQNNTIQQIKTFDRDYNPDDNVVIASIEFSMANQYIRDLSRNVKRGLAERVRLGEYPATPPPGYTREYKTRKIVLDPQAVPHVQEAFHLYNTGHWSIERIADKLYEDGFRFGNAKKIGKTTLHRILTNPMYTGMFLWKKQMYQGIHEPIISLALFESVGRQLKSLQYEKPAKPVEQEKSIFTYRDFLVCGECGLKVTAEKQKGYTYYRCTKSKGSDKCSQRYTREEEIGERINEELKRIHLDDDMLDLLVETSKVKLQEQGHLEEESRMKLDTLLKNTRARKNSLIEKFIDNAIPKEIYDMKFSEMTQEEFSIEEKIRNIESPSRDILKHLEIAISFIRTAHDIFTYASNDTRREITDIISSNIGIKDRHVAYFNLNDPFVWVQEDVQTLLAEKQSFERSKVFIQKKTDALAPVHSDWLGKRDSNPRSRDQNPVPYRLAIPQIFDYRKARPKSHLSIVPKI